MQQKRRRRLRRVLLIGLCILFTVGVCLVILDIRIRPILREYTALQAKTETGRVVNRAIGESVCRLQATFLDLQCGGNGRVLSVRVNEQALNSFKAELTQAVLEGLRTCERLPVSVPLGSVIGGGLLTGRGPLLCFPVHMSCTAVTALENHFSSAGINQTQHSVYVTVEVEMAVVLPDGVLRQAYKQTCVIGQTVLLGEVPQLYIGNQDNAALSRVLGYADI